MFYRRCRPPALQLRTQVSDGAVRIVAATAQVGELCSMPAQLCRMHRTSRCRLLLRTSRVLLGNQELMSHSRDVASHGLLLLSVAGVRCVGLRELELERGNYDNA